MQDKLLLIDRISTFAGKVFAWCVVIMTVAICYEVFMRYVMRAPTTWAYDAGYMLYGALFVMAGAYALATGAHVRGDVLYRLFPTRWQAGIDLVLYILFFFPAILALIYAGWIFAERSWTMGEISSASPAGLPIYHFKALIPLAACFLLLQGIAEVIRCVLCLKNGYWPSRVQDVKDIDASTAQEYIDLEDQPR
jgi:TRAP-type mannitol/chloroaromatic compound transport system permease small subunit